MRATPRSRGAGTLRIEDAPSPSAGLSYCDQLSDLSALADCASLRTLNLNGCKQLSDLSPLAGCPSLHTLYLYYNEQLSEVLVGC